MRDEHRLAPTVATMQIPDGPPSRGPHQAEDHIKPRSKRHALSGTSPWSAGAATLTLSLGQWLTRLIALWSESNVTR